MQRPAHDAPDRIANDGQTMIGIATRGQQHKGSDKFEQVNLLQQRLKTIFRSIKGEVAAYSTGQKCSKETLRMEHVFFRQ